MQEASVEGILNAARYGEFYVSIIYDTIGWTRYHHFPTSTALLCAFVSVKRKEYYPNPLNPCGRYICQVSYNQTAGIPQRIIIIRDGHQRPRVRDLYSSGSQC